MYQLRPYQQQAVQAGLEYFTGRDRKAGIIVMPTGAGKSLVIAAIAQSLNEPLIVFQPTKEILEQNYDKMMSFGIMGVDVYSASAGRKNIAPITLATIGSVFRKPDQFKQFKHVIADECHLVNAKAGMYKAFLQEVGYKLIGLTATPYRLNHDGFGGSMLKFLTRTNPRVFNSVLHVTQISELVRQGYWAPLKYYDVKGFDRSKLRVNTTGVDYLDRSLTEYYTSTGFRNRIVGVVQRLIEINRKHILVFVKFVEDAKTIAEQLGDHAAVVWGGMPKTDRTNVLQDFKNGNIKVVVNVGVLTIGFDMPELDAVVLARPTRSLILYYQMSGRCVRPHGLKDHAMIVDMCGNRKTFGQLEDLELVEEGRNLWYVVSKGKKLTNVYLDEVLTD